MCRNIKTLFNFAPPVTPQHSTNASLHFVCFFSGSWTSPFAASLFSAHSEFSVPSALNPSFSFDFQLSTFDRKPLPTNHQIGFPPPHPIKSPQCPGHERKRAGQLRNHYE